MTMKLTGVSIGTGNLERTLAVYQAICAASGTMASPAEASMQLGEATLTLRLAPHDVGITAITFSCDDLHQQRLVLEASDIPFVEQAGALLVSARDANGIDVQIESSPPAASQPIVDARLDHVALRVGDLAGASGFWSALTGMECQQMGLHPISGGAFSAARILLGERMIELIAPEPGVPSQIADRLASHGDGVAALALPVADVDAARARLAAIDARVLRQEPHWMVHPKDSGGVLVQLTPRVNH